MRLFRVRVFLGLFLGLTLSSQSGAADLQVQPLGVQLSANRPVAAMILSNDDKNPIVVQVKAYIWQQKEGHDVYTPTKDLLVTPPVITVPAGDQQLLRVALLQGNFPAQQERAYRLYIQQVPTQLSKAKDEEGIFVVLRLGLPVFVQPLVPPKLELQWQLKTLKNGKQVLLAKNLGNIHEKITQIELQKGSSKTTIETFTYLLPGQSQSWPILAKNTEQGTLSVVATTDQGVLAPVTAIGCKGLCG